MAYVIDEDIVPTCNKHKRRCKYDCDHCGVDYSKADEDDDDVINDDGFGTHW